MSIRITVTEPFFHAGALLAKGATPTLDDATALARIGEGRATRYKPTSVITGDGPEPLQFTAGQRGVAADPAAFSADGLLVNGAGGVLDVVPGGGNQSMRCFFSLTDGYGTSLAGNPNDTPLTLAGGVDWKPERGLNFNGAGRAYVSAAAPQHMLRSILNLDSLTADEMIFVYTVIKHPTSIAGTGTVFFFGRTAGTTPEGWGLELTSTLSPRFRHRALGAAGDDFTQLQLTNLNQSDGTNSNTMTALAMAISRTAGGDLEIASGALFLAVPGTFNGVNRSAVITPLAKPQGASRPARWVSDVSLTLGAQPGTSESSLNNIMPSGVSMPLIDFQRRPRDPSRIRAVLRELALSPYTQPASAALDI